jgi:DNA-binding NarL/FixJ family response regulator
VRCFPSIEQLALRNVTQDASAAEVVNALRAVAKGEAVCPARYALILFNYFALQTAGSLKRSPRLQLGLTRRELELIPLIDRGMTNKEIACHLNLSEQNVKTISTEFCVTSVFRIVSASSKRSNCSAYSNS